MQLLARRPRLVPVLAVAVLAVLTVLTPVVARAAQVQFNVDSPANGATISTPTNVQGWAVDQASPSNPGIAGVQLFLDGPQGQGRELGPVEYGLPRPDVAQSLGNPAWANSGFRYTFDPASTTPGSHRLYLYITATDGSQATAEVEVVVGAPTPPALPPPPPPPPSVPGVPPPPPPPTTP